MGRICGKRLSQKRSTCCGTSISSATSLMVRNASGAFSKVMLQSAPHCGAASEWRFRRNADQLVAHAATLLGLALLGFARGFFVSSLNAVDSLLENGRR